MKPACAESRFLESYCFISVHDSRGSRGAPGAHLRSRIAAERRRLTLGARERLNEAPRGLQERSWEPSGARKARGASWRVLGPSRGQKGASTINLAIMERAARESRERGDLQATHEQREQQEQREQERQDQEKQQGESGERLPRIETASPYDRLCPCAAAARPAPGGLSWESVSVTSFLFRPCVKSMNI